MDYIPRVAMTTVTWGHLLVSGPLLAVEAAVDCRRRNAEQSLPFTGPRAALESCIDVRKLVANAMREARLALDSSAAKVRRAAVDKACIAERDGRTDRRVAREADPAATNGNPCTPALQALEVLATTRGGARTRGRTNGRPSSPQPSAIRQPCAAPTAVSRFFFFSLGHSFLSLSQPRSLVCLATPSCRPRSTTSHQRPPFPWPQGTSTPSSMPVLTPRFHAQLSMRSAPRL